MANESLVSISHLTKDYGEGRGVFDISLDIPQGAVYGYCGPNGAGKTTTIRHMMGFLKPDQGKVTIFGKDSWLEAQEIKRRVGYIPGEIAFPDMASGTEFLKSQAEMLGLKSMARAEYVINKMQLDPTAKLKSMSKGMKQKTAIVAAFMAEPDLLILDEPTTGLDPLMRDAFLSLVQEEKKKGTTIFMSSHIFSEMEETCDKVAFIKDGFIKETIDLNELHHKTVSVYRIVFGLKGDYENFLQDPSFKTKDPDGEKLAVSVEVPCKETQRLFQSLSQHHILSFTEIKFTLEQCFDEMIQKEE